MKSQRLPELQKQWDEIRDISKWNAFVLKNKMTVEERLNIESVCPRCTGASKLMGVPENKWASFCSLGCSISCSSEFWKKYNSVYYKKHPEEE